MAVVAGRQVLRMRATVGPDHDRERVVHEERHLARRLHYLVGVVLRDQHPRHSERQAHRADVAELPPLLRGLYPFVIDLLVSRQVRQRPGHQVSRRSAIHRSAARWEFFSWPRRGRSLPQARDIRSAGVAVERDPGWRPGLDLGGVRDECSSERGYRRHARAESSLSKRASHPVLQATSPLRGAYPASFRLARPPR